MGFVNFFTSFFDEDDDKKENIVKPVYDSFKGSKASGAVGKIDFKTQIKQYNNTYPRITSKAANIAANTVNIASKSLPLGGFVPQQLNKAKSLYDTKTDVSQLQVGEDKFWKKELSKKSDDADMWQKAMLAANKQVPQDKWLLEKQYFPENYSVIQKIRKEWENMAGRNNIAKFTDDMNDRFAYFDDDDDFDKTDKLFNDFKKKIPEFEAQFKVDQFVHESEGKLYELANEAGGIGFKDYGVKIGLKNWKPVFDVGMVGNKTLNSVAEVLKDSKDHAEKRKLWAEGESATRRLTSALSNKLIDKKSIPFIGHELGKDTEKEIKRVSDKYLENPNSLTEAEELLLQATAVRNSYMTMDSGDWAGTIGEGVAVGIPYSLEFLATSGPAVSSATKLNNFLKGRKLFGNAIPGVEIVDGKKAYNFYKNWISPESAISTGAFQAAYNLPTIMEKQAKLVQNTIFTDLKANKDIEAYVEKNDKNVAVSWLQAYADTFLEQYTERLGITVENKVRQALGKTVASKWLTKIFDTGKRTGKWRYVGQMLKKLGNVHDSQESFLHSVGIHGLAGESYEELVNSPLSQINSFLFGDRDTVPLPGRDFWNAKELATIIGVSAFTAKGWGILNKAHYEIANRKEKLIRKKAEEVKKNPKPTGNSFIDATADKIRQENGLPPRMLEQLADEIKVEIPNPSVKAPTIQAVEAPIKASVAGEGQYFTTGGETVTTEGVEVNQLKIPTDSLNLKEFNSEQAVQQYIQSNNATTIAEAIQNDTQHSFDGAVFAGETRQDDIYFIPNNEKINEIISAAAIEETKKTKAVVDTFLRDSGLDKYVHAGLEAALQRPDAIASFTKVATDKGFISIKEGAAKPTTGYHELGHAYIEFFTTAEEKQELYREARSLYSREIEMLKARMPSATLDQLTEELIVEKMAQVETGQSVPGKLQRFIQMILENIKQLLEVLGNTKGKSALERFQRQMHYRLPPSARKQQLLEQERNAKGKEFKGKAAEFRKYQLKNMIPERNELTSKFFNQAKELQADTVTWKQMRAVIGKYKNQLSKMEGDILEAVLNGEFKNQERFSPKAFEKAVQNELFPLDIYNSDTYQKYGIENVGLSGSGLEANTHLFVSPFEHGRTGHFTSDFDTELKAEDTEIRQIPTTDQWAVLKKGETLTEENVQRVTLNVFDSRKKAEIWQESLNQKYDFSKAVKKGLFAHSRVWDVLVVPKGQQNIFGEKNGGIRHVAEIQSDVYQRIRDDEDALKLERTEDDPISRTKELIQRLRKVKSDVLKIIRLGVDVKPLLEKMNFKALSGDAPRNASSSFGTDELKKHFEKYGITGLSEWEIGRLNEYFDDWDSFTPHVYPRRIGKKDRLEQLYRAVKYYREKAKELDSEIKTKLDQLKELEADEEQRLKKIEEKLQGQEQQRQVFLSFQDNWHERVIKEEIRLASLHDIEQLRFPTPYTISKIEGYIYRDDSYTGLDESMQNLVAGDVFDHPGLNESRVVIGRYADGRILHGATIPDFEYNVRSSKHVYDYIKRRASVIKKDFIDGGNEDMYKSKNLWVFESYEKNKIPEMLAYLELSEKTNDVADNNGENWLAVTNKEQLDKAIDDVERMGRSLAIQWSNFFDDVYEYGHEQDVIIAYESGTSETEGIKTSGASDAENFNYERDLSNDTYKAVARFYDTKIRKYLEKIRKDNLRLIEDYAGNTWWETDITEADKAPVTVFQTEDIYNVMQNAFDYKGGQEDALTKEARKYKSAEEFIASQKKVYHGTNKDTKITKWTTKKAFGRVWFTDNKKAIEEGLVGASGKGKIYEVYLTNGRWATEDEADQLVTDQLISEGYDGVYHPGGNDTGNYYEVFNTDKIKTKSQLTNIWNKAQGETKYQLEDLANLSRANAGDAMLDNIVRFIGDTLNERDHVMFSVMQNRDMTEQPVHPTYIFPEREQTFLGKDLSKEIRDYITNNKDLLLSAKSGIDIKYDDCNTTFNVVGFALTDEQAEEAEAIKRKPLAIRLDDFEDLPVPEDLGTQLQEVMEDVEEDTIKRTVEEIIMEDEKIQLEREFIKNWDWGIANQTEIEAGYQKYKELLRNPRNQQTLAMDVDQLRDHFKNINVQKTFFEGAGEELTETDIHEMFKERYYKERDLRELRDSDYFFRLAKGYAESIGYDIKALVESRPAIQRKLINAFKQGKREGFKTAKAETKEQIKEVKTEAKEKVQEVKQEYIRRLAVLRAKNASVREMKKILRVEARSLPMPLRNRIRAYIGELKNVQDYQNILDRINELQVQAKRKELIDDIKGSIETVRTAMKNGKNIDVEYQKKVKELYDNIDLAKPTNKTVQLLLDILEDIKKEAIKQEQEANERGEEPEPLVIDDKLIMKVSRLAKIPLADMTTLELESLRDVIQYYVDAGHMIFNIKKFNREASANRELADAIYWARWGKMTEKEEEDFFRKEGISWDTLRVLASSARLAVLHSPRVANIFDGGIGTGVNTILKGLEGYHERQIRQLFDLEQAVDWIYNITFGEMISEIEVIKPNLEEEDFINITINKLWREGAYSQVYTSLKENKIIKKENKIIKVDGNGNPVYDLQEMAKVIPKLTHEQEAIYQIVRKTMTKFSRRYAAVFEQIENKPFDWVKNWAWPIVYRKHSREYLAPENISIQTYNRSSKKVEQGSTISRIEGVTSPVEYDFITIARKALKDQLWYIHFQPEIYRIHATVKQPAYLEKFGSKADVVENWWEQYLGNLARQGRTETHNLLSWSLAGLRKNMSRAKMFFRVTTLGVQPLATIDASVSLMGDQAKYVPELLLRSSAEWVHKTRRSIKRMSPDQIAKLSPLQKAGIMRAGGEATYEEIIETLNVPKRFFRNPVLRGLSTLSRKIDRLGAGLIQFADSKPALGAGYTYEAIFKRAGYSEEQASKYAAYFMNLSQGTASVVMRPNVLSGDEFTKTVFTLQSFALNRWGIMNENFIKAFSTRNGIRLINRTMNIMALMALFLMAGLEDEYRRLLTAVQKLLPYDPEGYDGETLEQRFIKNVVSAPIRMIPFIGDLVTSKMFYGSEPSTILQDNFAKIGNAGELIVNWNNLSDYQRNKLMLELGTAVAELSGITLTAPISNILKGQLQKSSESYQNEQSKKVSVPTGIKRKLPTRSLRKTITRKLPTR